ncbi:MAG: extracellular solute-binding protein [Lachnospiraceae bacterium]|nr:extracellular solute-binding protein [Lachnospiraceae bacterium]MBP5600558.1 extracellular solute-binding protein [Lachnospiraceae bacterium]
MKRTMKRFVPILATSLIGLALLAGCGVKAISKEAEVSETKIESGESSPTESDGLKKGTEGTLTVYTAFEDDQIDKYLESFYTKYPDIKVDVIRESTGTLIAKVIAEKDAPVADVIWGTSASVLLQLEPYGLIKGYTPEKAELLDKRFYDSENADALWTGCDVYETAFLVNTELCEQNNIPIPHSLSELTDPVYEGMIVMPDPTSSGTGMLTVNGILSMMGDGAWDYMSDLNKNIAAYTTSGSKPAKMAAAGECVIGISFGYRCATLLADGNPVEVVFPSEGCGWDVEANCLINKSEVNPCAYTFLDWAISDEAMAKYATEYPITGRGVIGEIPEGYSETPLENLCDLNLSKAALERDDIIEKFSPLLAGKDAN